MMINPILLAIIKNPIIIALTMCAFGSGGMFCIDKFYWWPSVAKKKKMSKMSQLATFGALVFFVIFLVGIVVLLPRRSQISNLLGTPEILISSIIVGIALVVIIYGALYPICMMFFKPADSGPFFDQGAFKWITLTAEGGGFIAYFALLICVAVKVRNQATKNNSLLPVSTLPLPARSPKHT